MVMTAPLEGLSGVVKSEVVVAADAHAAGPPATNAKALNKTGIHRPRDTRLEVTLHLGAKMVGWIMGVEAPISKCSQFASGELQKTNAWQCRR
jgi:hypothetical protein